MIDSFVLSSFLTSLFGTSFVVPTSFEMFFIAISTFNELARLTSGGSEDFSVGRVSTETLNIGTFVGLSVFETAIGDEDLLLPFFKEIFS